MARHAPLSPPRPQAPPLLVPLLFTLFAGAAPAVALEGLDGELCKATRDGDAGRVAELLSGGADPEAPGCLGPDNGGGPALLAAAYFGHATVVEALVEHGANIDSRDGQGWSALHKAAANGHTSVAKKLLDYGANISAVDMASNTALYYASGDASMTKLLLRRADATLMWAASAGMDSMVEVLIQQGANVSAVDDSGRTALMRAAMDRGRGSTIELLHGGGADIHGLDKHGHTLLHLAAKVGNLEVTKKLVDLSPNDRFVKDLRSQTPRDLALAENRPSILSVLPAESTAEACQRLASRWEAAVAMVACIGVCLLAVRNAGEHRNGHRPHRCSPTRGALLLASSACLSANQALAMKLFRSLDAFAACTAVVGVMQVVGLSVSVPLLSLAYASPLLLEGSTTELDLAVLASAVPVSLPMMLAWRRREGAMFAFGAFRLLTICLIAGSVWTTATFGADSAMIGRILNSKSIGTIQALLSNSNSFVPLSLPPHLDVAAWAAWDTQECVVDDLGCVSTNDSCKIMPMNTGITFVMNVSNIDGANLEFDSHSAGSGLSVEALNGTMPAEGVTMRVRSDIDTFRVCPMHGQIILLTPSVGELWKAFGLLSFASCGLVLVTSLFVGLWAASQTCCCKGSSGSSSSRHSEQGEEWTEHVEIFASEHSQQQTSACVALAMDIDKVVASEDGGAEEIHAALRNLEGACRSVLPVGALHVWVAIVWMFVDIALDLNCIVTFVNNEDIYFASVLSVVFSYSLTKEIARGTFRTLWQEMQASIRGGMYTDELLATLDQERGFEAVASLLVCTYGLPFAVKTPAQSFLGMLSILSSCHGVGSYIFNKIDLEGVINFQEARQAAEAEPKSAALLVFA